MPSYVFILRQADPSQPLHAHALDAIATCLDVTALTDPAPPRWIGDCQAETDTEARGLIEARLATLPGEIVPPYLIDFLPGDG
jgi:hypothetical protein